MLICNTRFSFLFFSLLIPQNILQYERRRVPMKKFLKILFIVILFILCIYLFYYFVLVPFKEPQNSTKNPEHSLFSLAKIVVYSSAYGENQDTTFEQNKWILDIFQYSDIALYIDNGNAELNSENTIKKLWIENIKISNPSLGSPCLYYLNSLNFGTANFNAQDKMEEKLEFTVLNDENLDTNLQYNTPTFFTDCSNPITLKYVNHSVKNGFEITSNEPLFFNGKLLQTAGISLENLSAKLQLIIHIINHNNEDFYYDLSLPIPLKTETQSILEGSVLFEKFYQNEKFKT